MGSDNLQLPHITSNFPLVATVIMVATVMVMLVMVVVVNMVAVVVVVVMVVRSIAMFFLVKKNRQAMHVWSCVSTFIHQRW